MSSSRNNFLKCNLLHLLLSIFVVLYICLQMILFFMFLVRPSMKVYKNLKSKWGLNLNTFGSDKCQNVFQKFKLFSLSDKFLILKIITIIDYYSIFCIDYSILSTQWVLKINNWRLHDDQPTHVFFSFYFLRIIFQRN